MKNKEKVIKNTKKEAEKFVDDFFDTPKLKRKITTKEMKKLILSQYDEEFP